MHGMNRLFTLLSFVGFRAVFSGKISKFWISPGVFQIFEVRWQLSAILESHNLTRIPQSSSGFDFYRKCRSRYSADRQIVGEFKNRWPDDVE